MKKWKKNLDGDRVKFSNKTLSKIAELHYQEWKCERAMRFGSMLYSIKWVIDKFAMYLGYTVIFYLIFLKDTF